MRDSVMQQVRQIAADIFNLPVEAVTAGSSPDTVESWDSLNHVILVLALEQNFNVQFLPEKIAEMSTIEVIASFVEETFAREQE